MKKNKAAIFCAAALWLTTNAATGQNGIPVGQWRTHFNYQQSIGVVSLNNRVYSNAFHGLLEVDLQSMAIRKLTKANALSDVGITAMAADERTGSLLVGYSNGNIDVIRESVTINLDALLRTNMTSAKRINSIFVGDKSFFVATGFGLLEVDLESLDVANTYTELGRGGATIGIMDGGVKGDSIVLATTDGILTGSVNTNLLDFRNWRRALANSQTIDFVEVSPDLSYAASKAGRLWKNEGEGWEEIMFEAVPQFLKLQGGELLYGNGNRLFTRTSGGQTTSSTLGISTDIADAVVGGESVWFADETNGLGQATGQGVAYFTVEGPAEKSIYDIEVVDNSLMSLGGGFEFNGLIPFNRSASLSAFTPDGWTKIDSEEISSATDASAVVSAGGVNNLYVLLYGKGIYQSQTGELINHQTTGSLLQASNGFVPVTAIAVDQEGNLVVSANQAGSKYMVRRSSGSWEALGFIPSSVPPAVGLQQNGYGDFWGILPHSSNGGIIVFNIESESYRLIGTGSGLPSSTVFNIAFDRDDYAWLATAGGLAIIVNTYEVFELVDLLVTYPVAENSFVLNDELIRTVAVDGANRKWIGNDRGLFLLDEFGAGSLTSFTRSNSPLPSNDILQMGINGSSGEVFVLTSAGLVSLRAEVTSPERVIQQAKIFPNPVLPGFSGVVAIEGLAFDTVVKITDQAGRLVREMVSKGGTATWNLADYNGGRVASGVYIVLAATRDGSQSVVGKIAVIN